MTGEETKKKNNDLIEQLKRENKDLKKLRDESLQNKRVTLTPKITFHYKTFLGCNTWNDAVSNGKNRRFWGRNKWNEVRSIVLIYVNDLTNKRHIGRKG